MDTPEVAGPRPTVLNALGNEPVPYLVVLRMAVAK